MCYHSGREDYPLQEFWEITILTQILLRPNSHNPIAVSQLPGPLVHLLLNWITRCLLTLSMSSDEEYLVKSLLRLIDYGGIQNT